MVESVYIINENITSKTVGNEAILLNFDSGEYFSLNETGVQIWDLLKKGHNLSSIIDILGKSHDKKSEDLNKDVVFLVKELTEKNLIRRAG